MVAAFLFAGGIMPSDLFPKSVQDEAFARQEGLCGICGECLDDVYYEAHHINRDVDDDHVDNCVLLCAEHPRNCHLLIHRWHTTNDPVEDYEFRFFDGDPDAPVDGEDGEDD
jgi:predicted restriction endonuclease